MNLTTLTLEAYDAVQKARRSHRCQCSRSSQRIQRPASAEACPSVRQAAPVDLLETPAALSHAAVEDGSALGIMRGPDDGDFDTIHFEHHSCLVVYRAILADITLYLPAAEAQ